MFSKVNGVTGSSDHPQSTCLLRTTVLAKSITCLQMRVPRCYHNDNDAKARKDRARPKRSWLELLPQCPVIGSTLFQKSVVEEVVGGFVEDCRGFVTDSSLCHGHCTC